MKSKASAPRRILLVEDHPIVREGLKLVLQLGGEFEVCAECADKACAMRALDACRPDAAIVDLSLQGASGLDLIKDIRARGHVLPILVLSVNDEAIYAERALKAGAQGYLMKEEKADRLLAALRRVLGGEVHVSEAVSARMIGRMVNHPRAPSGTGVDLLSDRELEIFDRIGRGETTAEMAHHLHISVKTVETHRSHIRQKLGVRNGHELVHYAIRWAERGESTSSAPARTPARRGSVSAGSASARRR